MELQQNQNQNIATQIEEYLVKLRHSASNLNYDQYYHDLAQLKSNFDKQCPPSQKHILKAIIPELNVFMEKLIHEHKHINAKNIKHIIFDFYLKLIIDQELFELFGSIVKIIPKILESDTEEIGGKTVKVLMEFLKNTKNSMYSMGEIIFEKITGIISNYFSRFETIINTNLAMINANEDRNRSPMLSQNSFKILNELLQYTFYFITNISKMVTPASQVSFSEITKRFIENLGIFFKKAVEYPLQPPSESKATIEHHFIIEDFLSSLTKGVYFYMMMKKVQMKIDHIPIGDIILIAKYIISNTAQRDVLKEILTLTYNLFKEYNEKSIFEERDFFTSDSSYIRPGIVYSDISLNEIARFILVFQDDFISKLSLFDEKCKYFESMVSRINDSHLSFDIKKNAFSYLTKALDILSVYLTDTKPSNAESNKMKERIFNLTNLLLEQLAFFYVSLAEILQKLDSFFLKEEKKTKMDFLEKNVFNEESNSFDMRKVQKMNLNHQLEILLQNEYEKYVLIDDSSAIKDIFNITVKLLIIIGKVITNEFNIQNIVPLTGVSSQTRENTMNMLNNNNCGRTPELSDQYKKIHQKTKYFAKIFSGFFSSYERVNKHKQHVQAEDLSKHSEASLIDVYLSFPSVLCVSIFKKIMPKIFQLLMYNLKVCPQKNCIIIILIDKIFEGKDSKDISLSSLKKEIFDIYFDYFSKRIYYIGNNIEEYDSNYSYNNVSMTFIINILKTLFRYIPNNADNGSNKIKTTLIINCILLSKNSQYFGNYIYVIRSLYKSQISSNQSYIIQSGEKENESVQSAYGILSYLLNIKEDYPFLKEMIIEILLLFPLKFKRLIEYAQVIFPSIIDSLNMTTEIIPLGLQSLENWMNFLTQKPENVNPFLQKNIRQLTNILTSHLYKNVNISLNSLKLLSKFGGKSRNYLEDKVINFKTSPTNILVLTLRDKLSKELLDFPVDNIIDIGIKIVTKKNLNYSIKTNMITFKACLLCFIKKEINYDYIMQIKNSIINNIPLDNEKFDSKYYFKHHSNTEEQIKVNMIYRKSEHFLFEKILRGLFLCFTIPELEKDIKDLIQFVCDYFVLAMISKNRNNKHMNIFEIDPITIFDMICEFLFTNNATVLRNSNQACTTAAKKLVIMIIDTIKKLFDNDDKVIINLEIIDIMYLKFFNSCYSNDWPKKGVGLILIDILIEKFSKEISFKYSKYILRAVFSVASSYSSIVKIKLQNECKDIIRKLVDMFLLDNDDYNLLTPEIINSNMELDDDKIPNAKESFIQMYHLLIYLINEISHNINSSSLYEISVCKYAIRRIYQNKKLKYNSAFLFVIPNIKLEDFLLLYLDYPQYPIGTLIQSNGSKNGFRPSTITTTTTTANPNEVSMGDYEEKIRSYQSHSKIEEKIFYLMSSLTNRYKLTDNNFLPMTSNALGMIFIYKNAHGNLLEFIFKDTPKNQPNFDLFNKMLHNIYYCLVGDLFFVYDIIKRVNEGLFLPFFKNTYMEKLYLLGKKIDVPFKIEKFEFKDEIPLENIDEVFKLVHRHFKKISSSSDIESYIVELFPILSEKLKMIKNFIKMAGYLFSDPEIEDNIKKRLSDSDRNLVVYRDLKQKTTNVILSYIMNREEAIVLKQCKNSLYDLIKSDSNLRDNILLDESFKKYTLHIFSINDNNGKNYPLKLVDSLLIITKSFPLTNSLIDKAMKAITDLLKNQDINDSYLLYLYSLISLLVYSKYEQIANYSTTIFEILISKEKEIYPKKSGLNFMFSKYKNKIIKLLTILRYDFAAYYLNLIKQEGLKIHAIEFIKKVFIDNKSYLIRETFSKSLAVYSNELIKPENVCTNYPVLRQYLKVLLILSNKSPRSLYYTPKFMHKLTHFFNLSFEKKQAQINLMPHIYPDVLKCEKYYSQILQTYIKTFNKNNHFIFNLFNLLNRTDTQTDKISIQLFSMIKLFSSFKRQKLKNIIYDFILHFNIYNSQNCLDSVLKYLIIPLIVKYFREMKKEDKEEKDDAFFVYVLKLLTELLKSKSSDENFKVEKWKLVVLMIIIYSEMFANTQDRPGNISDEVLTIFQNITYITNKQLTTVKQINSNVYLLLTTCLLSKLLETNGYEKHTETIINLCKNINDEYINISNVAYELIYLYSKDGKMFNSIIQTISKEKNNQIQLFQLFSLYVKYPEICKRQPFSMINFNSTFNYLYKIAQQFLSLPISHKKLLVQLLGIVYSCIQTIKMKAKELKDKSEQVNYINDIYLWQITIKAFKISTQQTNIDYENLELIKKMLAYIREFLIMSTSCDLMPFENTVNNKYKVYIHCYIYLIKLFLIFSKKKKMFYENIDKIFEIYKILTDLNASCKIYNDLGFMMRVLFDENVFNAINDNEKIKEDEMKKYKSKIFELIKKNLDGLYQNINKKKGKMYDLDFKSEIIQNDLDMVGHKIFANVKAKGDLFSERLVTIFPHNEFRFYILYHYFINSFIKANFHPASEVNELYDNVTKINDFLLNNFFENWYSYILFFLESVGQPDQKIKMDTSEYFKSNHSFYFNLRTVEELKTCKTESIDCIINSSLETRNAFKDNDYEVIQDTIICGFHFFYNSAEIMKTYGQNLNALFCKTFKYLNTQMVLTILEDLLSVVIWSPYHSLIGSNKFLFELLNSTEYIYVKVNPSLAKIALQHIERYVFHPNNPKQEQYISNALRILIYTSKDSDSLFRKKLFYLFEKIHGNRMIDILRWLFTYIEWNKSSNNTNWLPFSVDLLLNHFKGNSRLCTKDPFLSSLTNINDQDDDMNDMMIVDDDDYNEEEDDYYNLNSDIRKKNSKLIKEGYVQDKKEKGMDGIEKVDDNNNKSIEQQSSIVPPIEDSNNIEEQIPVNPLDPDDKIKKMIANYNKKITSIRTKHLIVPIRNIILIETTLSQKIWYSLFPQIWRILTKEERELVTVYINTFLEELIKHEKCYANIKGMIESFANCYPSMKISPEVMYALCHSQNTWTSSYFYLENLLISNIETERSYHCLMKILDILKEDQHVYGLQQYISHNEYSESAVSNLQCSNYFKVEEILTNAFKHYRDTLEKTELNVDSDEFLNEFTDKINFSIWESSLITSYKNTNKWSEVVTLSDELNNLDLKIEGMWHSGRERWDELHSLIDNNTQYFAQINQIYMMMKRTDSENESYKEKCMNCIKQIFGEFTTYPSNFEKLVYYHFLIFQSAVEAWESTNTLKEMIKNIETPKNSDFTDNLITWRDRLPHICEGFQSLKSILEPRNYLFECLRLLNQKHNKDEIVIHYPNISDKIWNNAMFIKYARKLQLYETFFEYVDLFNEEIKNSEKKFYSIIVSKNIEELKFIRQVTHNYAKGIEMTDKLLEEINLNLNDDCDIDQIKSSYNLHKAYFLYKEGKVVAANELFKKSADLYSKDYHIYNDWAEMSENVTMLMKGNEQYETLWFENTLYNYLMVIVFKLNKAIYIIPRLLSMVKLFPNQQLNTKFDKHLSNVPSWVWIFWLPNIFDHFKLSIRTNKSEFYFKILEAVAISYPQSIYYSLLMKMQEGGDAIKSYEKILKIIKENDKLEQTTDKIDIMIKEIEAKLERSMEEILLGQLNFLIDIQLAIDVKDAINKLNTYIDFLKKINTSGNALITKIIQDLTEVTRTRGVTIFALFDTLKHYRYYLHSKLTTENNYQELKHVLEKKLYNENFKGVEIPGLFSNKIIEPLKENTICISRFESEYSYKFYSFLNQKLLIRANNDKIFNFTLTKENIAMKSDIKLLQLQTLMNHIFASYKDTYQQKVKFNVPIVFFINNKIKIIQEEINQYYFNEIFEFCMQKNGYDPEVAYSIYEEQEKLAGPKSISSYHIPDITEKVYQRMLQIIPPNSLKSYVHKFIISSDEIFVFRKQFATSYALNSMLGYLFLENVNLNKISINKETGSCTFHDIKYRLPEDIQGTEKKRDIQMRLSKNISYFLSPPCLYGVLPSVIHAATRAIFKKRDVFEKILFSSVLTTNRVEQLTIEQGNISVNKFMKNLLYLKNSENETSEGHNPLKVIMDLIATSMSDDNLKKMPFYFDPWF